MKTKADRAEQEQEQDLYVRALTGWIQEVA